MTGPDETHRTVDAVWKLESARIIAGLTRMVRDVGTAEELAQDALLSALETWPESGTPNNPGAWLMTVAKRRAVDHIRRARRQEATNEQVARELERHPARVADNDVLRLLFLCAHPVLPAPERTALTLRLVGGLTPREIARAFLTTESTITRRVAAAKRTLAEAQITLEQLEPAAIPERLASVLDVIYLIFNEGYSATSGEDLLRPELCQEALRLGRFLAEIVPPNSEVYGLVALMELHTARADARTGPDGEPVQLHLQNRGRWNRLLINRGYAAMLRAREIDGPPGPYLLQAAIAVCHAQARRAEDTDWEKIASLYAALTRQMPTPVVRLNQAVAVGMAHGPQAGLDLVDTLGSDHALRDYHLMPSVRGDLLERLGRRAEAAREFQRAADLTNNGAERAFLQRRAMAAADTAPDASEPTVVEAMRGFLDHGRLSGEAVRSYGQTLRRLSRSLGGQTPLSSVTAEQVAQVFELAWAHAAPATWNRHRSALRTFADWVAREDLAAHLSRRTQLRTPARRMRPDQLEQLWARTDLPLRERTLWRLLRESAAATTHVLALNVEDLDLADRRAWTGTSWLQWRSVTARLLPQLIGNRASGPLFLSDRRPTPARAPGCSDLCSETGRRRLSYPRAEYLFKQTTKSLDPTGKGYTLRCLRPQGS